VCVCVCVYVYVYVYVCICITLTHLLLCLLQHRYGGRFNVAGVSGSFSKHARQLQATDKKYLRQKVYTHEPVLEKAQKEELRRYPYTHTHTHIPVPSLCHMPYAICHMPYTCISNSSIKPIPIYPYTHIPTPIGRR
jgi:hypothetical protein